MKTIAISILLSTLIASPSLAVEYHTIRSPTGQTIFEARFFDPGDGPFDIDDGTPQSSSWAWRPELKPEIVNGLTYWAEVIQSKAVDGNPTIINIGTDDEPDNAFGGSPLANGGLGPRTLLQHSLQGLDIDPGDLNAGSHGVFGLGDATYLPSRLTQIPLSGHDDLFSTTIHELAHGLGATSGAEDSAGAFTPRFGTILAGWGPLMVDDNGNPARPGQAVWCTGCNNQADAAPFDVMSDQGLLVGRNISEVLDGGLPGVPIKMRYEIGDYTAVDDNNMSHIELKNSVMSHQNYRNHKVFMEAELAVLQDLGYTIDRRNFFGRSVYGSGLDILNNDGFFARDGEGSQYLHGQYNKSSLGLGLHVYGSHNRVRQAADLLAAGAGGAGIRVDGEGNTIVIEPGTRVHANGQDGQGVMFTYGRNHVLVHRGDVEALGTRGVGLRFDFGSNGLGDAKEYRGSYIRTLSGVPAALLPELDGPLANLADITGRVAGREAAIYISDNAYVGSINIMRGAKLEGDIVSDYAQTDGAGDRRLTTISFGQRADKQGRATGVADPGFKLAHVGSIRGKENLTLSFDGGETSLNGTHQVYGALLNPGAKLSGNSTFDMTAGSLFTNHGTLAPGNSIGTITVNGDYMQTSSGRLMIEFAANGDHDVFAVTGNADLAGALTLAPMADWYSSAWSTATNDVVQAVAQTGGFDSVTLARTSPTIGFSAVPLGGHRYILAGSRSENAYSQYGQDANGWAAGQALQRLADHGPVAAQSFFRALDFSALNGSEVTQALSLVSPASYSAGLAASLQRERDAMSTALLGFGQAVRTGGSAWKGYAVAFGGKGNQDARNSTVGYDAATYGLVIGSGRRLGSRSDASMALHMDIADQSVNLKSPQWGKGKSTAFGVGAHLQYQANEFAGPYAYGGIRFGIEQGSMDRKVAVGDYYAAHSADWTGHSMSAHTGLGYRWRLSPAWSAGPFMSLNYASVFRPGVTESGPAATRLHLDSQRMDALRSSIGMAGSMMVPSRHGEVTAYARVGWEHEWMERDVTQTAAFEVWPAASFQTTSAVLPRNGASLHAGLNWQRSVRYTVSAELGGRWGSGYKALQGQLSMRWTF